MTSDSKTINGTRINNTVLRSHQSAIATEYQKLCREVDGLYLMIDEKYERLSLLLDSYKSLGGNPEDLRAGQNSIYPELTAMQLLTPKHERGDFR